MGIEDVWNSDGDVLSDGKDQVPTDWLLWVLPGIYHMAG